MESCQLEFQGSQDQFPVSHVFKCVNESRVKRVHESDVALPHFELSKVRQWPYEKKKLLKIPVLRQV